MNGKGKNYNENGGLEFEGEYLNGIRWEGKEYNRKGKIKAEYFKGKRENRECLII